MSSVQPFQPLFESLERQSPFHAAGIHAEASQTLLETLGVPLDHPGRCILLRAPRAGYGKTHLISHLQQQLSGSHEFIPLHPVAGSRVDAASVTEDLLRRVTRPLPDGGDWCGLDWLARRLFAVALQPLVKAGEVPCQDRTGALASLRDRPVEIFDFHDPNAFTAHWFRDHFKVLGPRLARELAQLTGCSPRALGAWLEVLCQFAVAPPDGLDRFERLFQAALPARFGEGVALERLAALLELLGLLTRVVLVVDDVEGCSAAEPTALRLAAFLSALRQFAAHPEVILAVNRDVWDSAIVPSLSGGLEDRLAEVVIDLEGLTEPQMLALLDSRTPGHGARLLEALRAAGLPPYARGLLRAAGAAWNSRLQEPLGPLPAAAGVPTAREPLLAPLAEEVPAVPSGLAVTSPGTVPAPNHDLAHAAADVWHDLTGPTSPFDTHPEPVADVPAVAPPPAAVPPPIDHDRVEDLLRQFRERYSRPAPDEEIA